MRLLNLDRSDAHENAQDLSEWIIKHLPPSIRIHEVEIWFHSQGTAVRVYNLGWAYDAKVPVSTILKDYMEIKTALTMKT